MDRGREQTVTWRISYIESRGFVLLMLNHLRLKSDADDSGLVHRIMSSHQQYKEFLPTLRYEFVSVLGHVIYLLI